jgi:protein-L-isoaspartate O-methyltransferase
MDLKAGDRVYHLGCGGGYYTAIMAEIVGPGGSVVGIEVHPDLAAHAKENLSCYPNVTVHAADGATFDPGPCDAMLINAGTTHPIPLWLDRLREGGRLVVPLTMGTTPTLGVGVMTRIIHEHGGFFRPNRDIVANLFLQECSRCARAGRYLRDSRRRCVLEQRASLIRSVRHCHRTSGVLESAA